MSSSSSHSHTRGAHSRGAHSGSGGGSHDGESGGGGGGGGGGKLVKVGFARTQAEAEMMQGLLLDGGVPSVLKRTRGFDNPDFMASGPHDVMVDSAHAKKAKGLLEGTMIESEEEAEAEILGAARRRHDGDETSPTRLAYWVLTAFIGAVLLIWVLYQLT